MKAIIIFLFFMCVISFPPFIILAVMFPKQFAEVLEMD